ncbi:MAG: M50 family metallopeptidase [Candidatus Brocadiaceae bacterium]|nr:M50 family metallopeptidase [Candidatus Brocadiaceae bacterium]
MIYFSLAIGLVLIIFLSFATYGLWMKYINNKLIQGFLLPGSIVHELSHALLCLITGTTIKELNIFAHDNSGIQYDRPKVPIIFDFIIAFAPIGGCFFFILFISKILSNPISLNNTFPKEIHFTFEGLFDLIEYLFDSVWATFTVFREDLRISNMSHVFFLLTVIIFTVSIAPHKQDIKYLVLGTGILSAILFFSEKIGFRLLKYSWWNSSVKQLWILITLTISVLATLLFFTLIILGFIKGYKLTFDKGTKR